MSDRIRENHNISVIYAEDEPIIRWSVSDELRVAGFNVHEAGNGAEALDLIASGIRFDAVVTDINMPGEPDGSALASQVMRDHPGVPVVVTSSVLPIGLVPSLFLAKPFAISRLVEFLVQELNIV